MKVVLRFDCFCLNPGKRLKTTSLFDCCNTYFKVFSAGDHRQGNQTQEHNLA